MGSIDDSELILSHQGLSASNHDQVSDRTTAFWRQKFEGLEASVFPTLPSSGIDVLRPERQSEHFVSYDTAVAADLEPAVQAFIPRAALAVLLSRYSNSSEALFGIAINQPHPVANDPKQSAGTRPEWLLVPTRINCDSDLKGADLLRHVAADDAAIQEFNASTLDLESIRHMSEYGSVACGFQTVLRVVVTGQTDAQAAASAGATTGALGIASDRALLIDCYMGIGSTFIRAQYDDRAIDGLQVARVLRQLGLLIEQLQTGSVQLPISKLNATTPSDLEEISSWNSTPMQKNEICIHDYALTYGRKFPDAIAISSWDGEWTYAQLDKVTSDLADHILTLGEVEVGQVVALCFERSKWTVAAMLAVNKAGLAFTLVDPSLPPARIANMCEQTSAKLAFTSQSNWATLNAIFDRCIVLDQEFVERIPQTPEDSGSRKLKQQTRKPQPSDLAYVIFSSGSTGEPKGSMVAHWSFTSSASELFPALGLDHTTRTIQFASYAFATSLVETFATLGHGGCVCIPSADERINDTAGFINRSKANWAIFTPSFISSLRPEDVPSLTTLVVGGEPLSTATRDAWASKVRLFNGYGLSESSGMAAVHRVQPAVPEPHIITRTVCLRIWLTDPNDVGKLAPVGAIGEITVETPCLALGYLPSSSAEARSRFLQEAPKWRRERGAPYEAEPFRMFRTGDLGRYKSDGSIVYLGRSDLQVKIRGQRVEMGDVETNLRRFLPSDTPIPIVEAIPRPDGRMTLVAFLTGPLGKGDKERTEETYVIADSAARQSITSKLLKVLPQYCVPTHFIRLKELPKTVTGKTSRKDLRAIGARLLSTAAQEGSAIVAIPEPNGDLGSEKAIALRRAWSQAFDLNPQVPVSDSVNFLDLGGDSITAIKLVNLAREQGVTLKVTDLMRGATLASLADKVQRQVGAATAAASRIPVMAATHEGPVQQSFAQGRMWFLHQLNPDSTWYLTPVAMRLRGTLRIDALEAALNAIEERHETLRTTFEDKDGLAIQVVHPMRHKKLRIVDVDEATLAATLREEQTKVFDLTSDPAWRVCLFRVVDDDNVISIVMHHIISDGWSMDILRQELAQLYSAAVMGPLNSPLPPLPLQYWDFSVWQRQPEQTVKQRKQLEYWKGQLTDSSPAELLLDRPRPTMPSGRAGVIDLSIQGRTYKQVIEFAKLHRTTPFAVMFAAFRAAHYRLVAAEDATIAVPTAARTHAELEPLIGFFVNTLCIRTFVDGDQDNFESLVRNQVHPAIMAAFDNQDVPFEHIVNAVLPAAERDTSRNPLAQLSFVMHSGPDIGTLQLEGVEVEPVTGGLAGVGSTTRFDLEMHLFHRQQDKKITGHAMYATDLFERETAQALVDVFQEVLRQGLAQPRTPISVLPLVEIPGLSIFDIEPTPYPRDSSIVDIFRQQVAAFPDAIAACDSAGRMTYSELDDKSDKLAAWLRHRGIPAETPVGILSPRSCQTLVAMIGVLKANLACLPLNVDYSTTRIKHMLSSAKLVNTKTQPTAEYGGRSLVLLGSKVSLPKGLDDLPDTEIVAIEDALKSAHEKGLTATDSGNPTATSLAAIIFTSGSTGKPKGSMLEHRSIVRLVKDSNVVAKVPPAAAVAHVANISFDVSMWEMYTPLLNGGTVVCIDYLTTLDIPALAQVFARERVSAALLSPVLVKQILQRMPSMLAGLEVLILSGDRFDVRDAKQARALVANLYNSLGPSECCVLNVIYRIDEEDELASGVVPLGRPVSNDGLVVMDSQQNPVPAGVMGELVVFGDGLSRGYTNSALDKNRFIHIDLESRGLTRAYRSGDRVRVSPKARQIEFFGRMDMQVKIRGHRVEPAEVEQVMLALPVVRDAVVVVRQGEDEGEKELVAFVVADDKAVAQQTQQQDQGKKQLGDSSQVEEQVKGWSEHFDVGLYTELSTVQASAIGRDFLGWKSMYDGSAIPLDEMTEWLDDTMRTILDGHRPAGHVLEIGTGSGMILFNLGQGLKSYAGLEPSETAATFVNKTIDSIPTLRGKAQVHVGTATDASRILQCQGSSPSSMPELVILNSVVQYFPTIDYLADVMETLTSMPGARRIVLGDLRSYPLNRQFLVSRALRSLGRGEAATKAAVRRKVMELEDREEELLVDPAFFTALAKRFSSRVSHVEILPKVMRATNELSAYRFAAVVHVREAEQGADDKTSSESAGSDLIDINAAQWVDFSASGMDRESLVRLLKESAAAGRTSPSDDSPPLVAVCNIPNSKNIAEGHLVKVLEGENGQGAGEEEDDESEDWVALARSRAESSTSLSAADLVELAQEAGLRVGLSWARQRSQQGGIDAVFYRDSRNVRFRFPVDGDTTASGSQSLPLANRPLQRQEHRRIVASINESIRTILPSYMVPAQIVVMAKMPFNPNGKVDRKALRSMAHVVPKTQTAGERVEPRNEVEAILCEEFSDVLGVQVGVSDNFFTAGGHSLLAQRLAARLSSRLDTRVSVKNVFDRPVVGQLAAIIRRGSTPDEPIPSLGHRQPTELSFGQNRLWFIEQVNPDASVRIPLAVHLSGPLNMEALESALASLQERHETLRTTFKQSDDGVAMQFVHPASELKTTLKVVDMTTWQNQVPAGALDKEKAPSSTLTQAIKDMQNQPFDLSSEPAWRSSLLRYGPEDNVLVIILHHIIYDGGSIEILTRELELFYAAALRSQDPLSTVEPLPIQYRDFAAWQKQGAELAKHERQLEYWSKTLHDSTPAELFTDFHRPAMLSGRADIVPFVIDGPLYDRLRTFSRTHQITTFATLLAVFRAAHYRLTGAADATIAMPISNRSRPELENLMGFFVNTLCIRIPVGGHQTFAELAQQVRNTTTASFSNQDVPFERVVSTMMPGSTDMSRNPLAQILFAVHSQQDLGKIKLEGLASESLPLTAITQMDVEFHVFQEVGRLKGQVMFSTDLFRAETISNLVLNFKEVLRRCLDDTQLSLAAIPLTDGVPRLDKLGMLEPQMNDYPRDSNVVEVFRAQVAKKPSATAVTDLSYSLTYQQLDEQSDRLASWLRRRHLAPEALVAVLSPRACETVVAFLGVLKANLAYIPLDVNAPPGRIDTILSCVPGSKLVLLGAQVPQSSELKAIANVELVRIGDAVESGEHEAGDQNLNLDMAGPSATSLAYTIFTSGSTGKPKGVMLEHRAILRIALDSNLCDYFPESPVVSNVCNLGFDVSVQEIWTALLRGGTLVCVDHFTLLDSRQLEEVFMKNKVSVAILTPALIRQCLTHAPDIIRRLAVLISVADKMDPGDAMKASKLVSRAVLNGYGPTENGMLSTIYEVDKTTVYPAGIPIGHAITNSGAVVMDSQQRIVSPGVIGELVVTGDGLARGYADPVLNRDRFVDVTIKGRLVRAYRTGDRVRWRPDDYEIDYFGREGQLLKIRGHLVEPAEVEAALLAAHEAVESAAVVGLSKPGSDTDLVGFIRLHGSDNRAAAAAAAASSIESQTLKALRMVLPTYMVPVRVVVLEEWPLNASGKLDRKQLGVMAENVSVERQSEAVERDYVAPSNEVEAALCQEFANAIGLTGMGVTHNFFELGGNSLGAMKLAARISRRFKTHITVKTIFDHPVPRDMANSLPQLDASTLVDGENGTGDDSDPPASQYESFQLCPVDDVQHFVKSEICPRLDHKYRDRVVDVYPASTTQGFYANDPPTGKPRSFNTFSVDFPAGADPSRVIEAFEAVMQHYDSLRTVIVRAQGRFWQVVLDRLEEPVETLELPEGETDFEPAVQQIIAADKQNPPNLGQAFIRVALLRTRDGPLRLMFRMSHAIWDGMSLGPFMKTFHSLYKDLAVPPSPRFALYLESLSKIRDQGISHWSKVLQGSSVTVMQSIRESRKLMPVDRAAFMSRVVHIPPEAQAPLGGGITQATIFTAACATVIAKETNCSDLLFGNVVSGRQFLPTHLQNNLVGHCGNLMPVRIVGVDEGAEPRTLVKQVQDQYLEGLAYEAITFDDIKENAGVEWRSDADRFGLATAFMNFEQHPESTIGDSTISIHHIPPEIRMRKSTVSGEDLLLILQPDPTTHDMEFVAFPEPDGRNFRLGVTANLRLCESGEVDHLIEKVCDAFVAMNKSLR